MNEKKVAVIGAGPMGLAVAYQLAMDGFTPIIYEADDRIGGMSATFDFDSVEIERYYHFHCVNDKAFFEVLRELFLYDKLVWKSTKMGYWYRSKVQPWGNPLALLLFDGIDVFSKIRYALHAYMSTKRNDWCSLEKTDAVTWIKKWIGSKAYEVLWKKLLELKFYHYSSNLSAPWIWSRIRRIGRSRYDLFHEKLGYLEGGSAILLNAMKNKIEELGGQFLLSTPVEQIFIKDNIVRGIHTSRGFEEYSNVISTIPLPLLGNIVKGLDEQLHLNVSKKQNIAVICIIVKLRQPLTHNFWLNVNDSLMDIPGIIEYGNLNPEKGQILYIPYYVPREHPLYAENDSSFEQKTKKYLKMINPSLSDSDFLKICVHRYAYAQPICEPKYRETLPDVRLAKGFLAADASYYYPEDRGISESIGFGREMAKRISDCL